MEILIRVEKLIIMANALVIEHPGIVGIKALLSSFEELKTELIKPELDKNKIGSIVYGITRVFTEMLDWGKTPFGEELGKLLTEYYYARKNKEL
jgi:hypothetical protein